jgi:hypothetical protein
MNKPGRFPEETAWRFLPLQLGDPRGLPAVRVRRRCDRAACASDGRACPLEHTDDA